MLTLEEKQRIGPQLIATWEATKEVLERDIPVFGRKRIPLMIEAVCDLYLPVINGGMTHEDYLLLLASLSDPDVRYWLHKLFKEMDK